MEWSLGTKSKFRETCREDVRTEEMKTPNPVNIQEFGLAEIASN